MLTRLIKKVRKNPFLTIVLLFAVVLRSYDIVSLPPSLNWDEVSHGYNAYSILKTGKDEWGNFLPFIFRAYGDFKLPVYIYLTAVSEVFFGLTAFAVRLPSVLAGVGSVLLTYLLTVQIFKSKKLRSNFKYNVRITALIAALLVAIEPWSLFLSRGGFEANLALFFFAAGMYFFFRFVSSQSKLDILYSSILFGLTVWTYNSYRIFTPLMLVLLTLIYKKELSGFFKTKIKSFTYFLFPIAFFIIPMFWQLLNISGSARYEEVKILDQGTISKINEARGTGGSRFVHNKVTYFLLAFTKNYVSHFSPEFLFLEGGSHYQFSVPGHGVLYPINALFILIGIIYTLKSKSRSVKILLMWMLLAPLSSSLTREAPHVLRSITFLPVPMILAAIGFGQLAVNFNKRQKIAIYLLYLFALVFFLLNYFNLYAVNYKNNYSWSWQYGYKEAVKYIENEYDNYEKVIITKKYGEPHEFLLFYIKWNPQDFRNDPNLNRFYQSNWYWVDSFDKFYFVNDWSIPKEEWGEFVLESGGAINCPAEEDGCLLITSPGNVPKGWSKLDTINFLDGKPAFEIYEN